MQDDTRKQGFVESLELLQLRLLLVFIFIAVICILTSIRMLLSLHESKYLESSFQTYVGCLALNGGDETKCPHSYRQYLYVDFTLTIFYTWPATKVIFLLYFSAYKEVRELWLYVFTCGLYFRKRDETRGHTVRGRDDVNRK